MCVCIYVHKLLIAYIDSIFNKGRARRTEESTALYLMSKSLNLKLGKQEQTRLINDKIANVTPQMFKI